MNRGRVFLRKYQETPMMRRSSRIQIKQEGNGADQKSELSQPNRLKPRVSRLPVRTMKVISPKRKTSQKTSLQPSKPFTSKKQTKGNCKIQNGATNCNRGKTSDHSDPVPSPSDTTKPRDIGEKTNTDLPQGKSVGVPQANDILEKTNGEVPQAISNEKATTSGKIMKNELSIPLLLQDDSNDSILSDVANSLKIDRTIKNLSPKKFFHNKDPKTTRSGRSFSPYDFASYSALFGSICANQNKTKSVSKAGVTVVKKDKREGMQSNKHNKRKKYRRDTIERLKSAKRAKTQNTKHPKTMTVPPVEFEEPSEIGGSPVEIKEEFISIEKSYQNKVSKEFEDYLLSEKVPASFWLEFPFPRFPTLEGHCLPADFWERDFGNCIPAADWEVGKKWYVPRLNPDEMTALSKVTLADADKYDFKSVFKDVSSQMANFEDSCGEWNPSPTYGKFDVMEAESAEGRRFYRKRITDTRLIAWQKYNLASSTRYCPDTDIPTTRPVIKVRSNPCHKADLVWRLNQTQPPPSIEDVLNGPVISHPDTKHNIKLSNPR